MAESLEAERESNLRESGKQTIKDICNQGKQAAVLGVS